MASTVMTFPRELEFQFWRDTDREFLIISIVGYIVILGLFALMAAIGSDYSDEHARRTLEKLYQIKPVVVQKTTTAPTKMKEEKVEVKEETGRTKEIASRTAEKKEMSAADRAARRAAEAGARERAAGAAVNAAQSVGIFKQAGVRGGIGGGRGGGAVEGLSTGAGSGADANKLSGLGVSGSDLAGAKALRSGGKLIEGGGGKGGRLNLSQMSTADIENLIKAVSVKAVSAPQLGGSGKAMSAKGRSSGDISSKVSGYSNQIKACFQQFLRRDPNLEGQISFSFTIKANGTVSGVRMTNSQWSDSGLGRQVESCVRERVQTWKFDQIDPASGDITVNYSYVFSR